MNKYAIRFWLIFTFLIMMATLGRAAVDRTPNVNVGAVYKTSRSTLVSGDFDSLAMDVNHQLLVTGSIAPSPGATNPTPFTTTSSNGVTAVTLVALTGGQVIIPWSLTIYNTDTVAHRVDVLTSSGTAIWGFILAANTGAAIYDGAAAGFAMRTLTGEGLQFSLPSFGGEGGSGTSVKAIGYTTKQ